MGISSITLLKLEEQNKILIIKTISCHCKYNVQKYINDNKKKVIDDKVNTTYDKQKLNLCYVRVSTQGQKSDLKHQKNIC